MSQPPVDSHSAPADTASNNLRMTCLGCGCLCDGLVVNKVSLNEYFSSLIQKEGQDLPTGSLSPFSIKTTLPNKKQICQHWMPWINQERKFLRSQKEVKIDFHRSCQNTHEILTNAKRPALFGFSRSSAETIQKAILLAEKHKAIIDPAISLEERAKISAFCQTGKSSSSWKEAGRNCEEVIFWKCTPDIAPCFFSQLKLDPYKHKLFFLNESNSEESINHPELANWPKESIISLSIPVDDLQTLQTIQLLELNRHSHLSSEEVLRLTGNTETTWKTILKSTKRQCWIFDRFAIKDTTDSKKQAFQELCYESIYKFSTSHQPEKPRYVHFCPNETLGSETATQTMTSMTGFPFAVDFSDPKHPRFDPIQWRFENLINKGQVDAIILVEPEQQLVDLLDKIDSPQFSTIEIGYENRIPNASVFLQCSRLGIHQSSASPLDISSRDTLFRPDGTTVQVTGFLDSTLPSARNWLEGILAAGYQT